MNLLYNKPVKKHKMKYIRKSSDKSPQIFEIYETEIYETEILLSGRKLLYVDTIFWIPFRYSGNFKYQPKIFNSKAKRTKLE